MSDPKLLSKQYTKTIGICTNNNIIYEYYEYKIIYILTKFTL